MWKILVLFLFSSLLFSQSKPSAVEERIYNSIDAFVANPSKENLEKLTAEETKFRPITQNEYLALVILNCNKAYYENSFDQSKKAIASYEKAWLLFQKKELSNYDIIESCLKPLGNLYTVLGDYESAENTIKQYFYIAETERNELQKYAATLNLSNVYHSSGRPLEAVNLIEKTVFSTKLTSAQKGVLWNNLGNNYLSLGNTKKASDSYTNSILLLKNEKQQAETLSNSYRNAALLNNDLVSFSKAKKLFYQTGKKELKKVAKWELDEARLLFRNGQLESARQANSLVFKTLIPDYDLKKGGLPDKKSLYAETILLDALDLYAELYLAQNQPGKALESYALSFEIESMFQSLLVYENSKIITQIRNRNRTEKCLGIYYNRYKKERNLKDAVEAFFLAEQTKSAVLRSSVLESKKQSREEKLMAEQLQHWNTIIVKEQLKAEKADIAKINKAIKKQNELMLLIKSKTSEKSTAFQQLSATELYAKLKNDNALLVEYFFGSEQLYIFTIEDNSVQLEAVNLTATKQKIDSFIECFSRSETISNNPHAFCQLANSAYQILKLPMKQERKNLIIIPDGILAFLPFEALLTKQNSTSNFAKMPYLLYDFQIGYNNSADFYLHSIPFRHQKESILGVFPVFQNSNLALPFSKKELENLKANFKGKYLEGAEATFKNFRSNAADYSVVHLSTHASSGDIFEPATIKFYDQEVLYSELYSLNLSPSLVVLSACETGLGKWYKAEGAMSVARGFQFAGAQNLLFSLWKVNDYTTSVLMEKFYGNVKKGNSYFEANHQSKLDFLADESVSNAKKSPYYWSSFVYYGTLESKETTPYKLYIVLGLVAIISVFLFFKKHQNRRGRLSKNPHKK